MGSLNQTWALVAILVAALSSYSVGRLSDQHRFKREIKIRWDQRRLDAYVKYLTAVKATGTHANRVHERRFTQGESAAADAVIDELVAGELRRSEAFELLILLADGPTITAGHELNKALWNLVHPARTGNSLSKEDWEGRNDAWVRALNDFHVAARADLQVQGMLSRRDVAAVIVSQPDREQRSSTNKPSTEGSPAR